MFLHDIKNSIWNKKMLLSMILSFACLILGGSEVLFGHNERIDFSYMFLYSLSSGSASLLALIYPVFACTPYSDIYCVERNTGFLLYKRLRSKKSRYIIAKLVSCTLSGGIAISVPVALYLGICIILKGTNLVDGGMVYITHFVEFYQNYPLLYCLSYVANAFVCGMIFSLMGLAISIFIRNKYLVVFIPLVIYILMNIIFSGSFINLNPTLWWDINLYAESSIVFVNSLKAVLLLLFSVIFSIGVTFNGSD